MPPLSRTRAMIALLLVSFIITPALALDLSTDKPPSATPSISQGDSVFVHGTATGHPQQGLQVWLIGTNYARVTNIAVNNDNSFEYELKRADTQNLASGQYFVLVQHPMMNGQFDITYNAATGQVTNRQLGGGSVIFQLTGAGSLQAPAAAAALVRAVADQNIDDMFTTVTFFIEPAGAFIDPIGEHAAGDQFTIGGTTNLAVGDDLLVEIYSASFRPTTKGQSGEFSGSTGIVKVQPGTGRYNRWSFPVDAAAWKPDEYIVTVSAVLQNVRGSTTFTITEKRVPAPTVATSAPVTTVPATPVATTVPLPAPTTKKTPLPACTVPAAALLALILHYSRGKL